MQNGLVTLEDLEKAKTEIIEEVRRLLREADTKPIKKWMKSKEVMALLGISPGKLQTMRKSRQITFMRIGGSIYYDQYDIQKMYDQNKVTSKK